MHPLRLYLLVIIGLLSFYSSLCAVERTVGPLKCSLGRDYWLGFPHGYDEKKTYWLVVAVHGAGGTGEGMKGYSFPGPRDDYIVVAPSFPINAKEGYYQVLQGNSDVQLIKLFQELKVKYPLQDKLFLYGFSGGSQYSHRFTMAHPEVVVGCSAHSGGSWGPEINKKAMGIPLFFSCGLDDTSPSVAGALPRIEEAEKYFTQIQASGMLAKLRYWQGIEHSPGPKIPQITAECYELATTGLFPKQRQAWDEERKKIEGLIAQGSIDEAKKVLRTLQKYKFPMPGPKLPTWMSLNPQQQEEQRNIFIELGIGGKSKLGRDIWINDSNENEYGWNESPGSRAAQSQGQRSIFIRDELKVIQEKLPKK